MPKKLGFEKESESIYQLLQNGPDMVVITDAEARIVAINKRTIEVTGFTADEVIGENPRLWNSGRQSDEFYEELWDTIESGEIWEGNFCNQTKYGNIFWTHSIIVPIFDDGEIVKYASIHDNITNQHRLQERLRATVSTTSNAIITTDSDGVIEDINSAAKNMFSCSERIVGQKIEIIMPRAYNKLQEYVETDDYELLEDREEENVQTLDGTEFPADVEINDFETDTGRKFVFMAVDRTEEVKYRNKIESLNARKDQELQIGRDIQQELLPDHHLELELYDIGLKYEPSTELGGDFYNFIHFEEAEKTLLCLADAAGHGVPAALLSTLFKAQADLLLNDYEDLSQSIARLNQRLHDLLPKGKFLSTFFLVLDHNTPQIEFFKFSQEPGLLLQNGEELKTLETDGVLLGAFETDFLEVEDTFKPKQINLNSEDRIILYTDGITEAEDPSGEPFGDERFYRLIKEKRELNPEEFSKKVLASVRKHTQSDQLADDFSIVVIDLRKG